MQKGITPRYFTYIASLFYIGNAYILGSDSFAGPSSWLSLLISAAVFVPIMYMYGRLIDRYPGRDLYGIMDELLGRQLTSIFTVIYIIYGIGVLSMSLSCCARFIFTNILPETPKLAVSLVIGLCSALVVCGSYTSMAKWTAFLLPAVAASVGIALIFSIPVLRPGELLPIAYPLEHTLFGAYRLLAFPYGEPIILTAFLPAIRGKLKYRHIVLPWVLMGIVLALTYARNTMVLGGKLEGLLSFSTYHADAVAGFEEFQQRIEVLSSFVPAVSSTIESAAALLFSVRGVMYLTGAKRSPWLIAPLALAGVAVSAWVYSTNIALETRSRLWPLISVPLQFLIPFICLVLCMIRRLILQKSRKPHLKRRSL